MFEGVLGEVEELEGCLDEGKQTDDTKRQINRQTRRLRKR